MARSLCGRQLLLRVVATLALGVASAQPSPALALGFPSPADWRDVTIYQVVTDRFFDGNPANDNAQGAYNPSDGSAVHGGDWQGLHDRLDYITGLGVRAIWISPVVLNAHGEYHGYAARDLSSYSPTMGGLAALQSFVSAAHARGLYVIVDIVANHMADLIDSGSPGYPTYDPSGSYVLRWRNPSLRHAPPFDSLALFHNYGQIGNFTDPEQILGELFGLDDLRTESTTVRDALANAYAQLIAATDCDGFRVDTVKHAEMGFWQDFLPRIRAAAAADGKTNFLLLGEVFDGDPAKVGSYTGTQSGGPYLFDSVTWFPMAFAARWVFSGNGQPSDLAAVYADSGQYDPTTRGRLGNFFDNHDLGRLASFGLANQDDALLRIALTWLLTSPGLPILYYGTEQEYDGGGDPWNREDLFDGQWDFGPSQGDGFQQAAPLYVRIRALNDLRAALPALRRGGMTLLRADSGSPGVLAYLRTHASGDVLVILNTSTTGIDVGGLSTPWSPGTVLRDPLSPARTVVVGAGGTVSLHVAGKSAALLLPGTTSAVGVRVVSVWPPHDGVLQMSGRGAKIVFDRPMTPAAQSGVSFDPPLPANIAWRDSHTLLVWPQAGWSNGAVYTLRVAQGVVAQDGTALPAAFSFTLKTALSGVPLSLPIGFSAEEVSPFGLQQPLAMEVIPWGWASGAPPADLPLASDVRRNRILSLSPAQKVSTFSVEVSEPITGLELDASTGLLAVASPAHLVWMDGLGNVVSSVAAPAAWEAPHVGIGAHAGRVYLGSPSADAIYKIEGASVAVFASGLGDPRGMAQPPPGSGSWDDLVVCDPDLGGGSGSGNLYRINAAGVRLLWVSDPAVAGVTALAFAPPGPFGEGDLYALDALSERILRIDPSGQVSVFATGFENLYGSDALAFGTEGDLYVLDPGGSESITNTHGSAAPPRLIRIVAQSYTAAPPSAPSRSADLWADPNPFNPRTVIHLVLPAPARAHLAVYDVAGRQVATLWDGRMEAGERAFVWDGTDRSGLPVASGVYYARLDCELGVAMCKVALVR